MTNEEFEKRSDFILEQQAQFAADIQQLREAQAQTDQVVAQTGEIVARLANVTLEGFKDVNAKIDALVDAQIKTDEKINALADSQIRTDGDLRNLIAVVDRYFSEGRNGNNLGS
jgi:anion-transporting  ArsA/GET3 family ATPase